MDKMELKKALNQALDGLRTLIGEYGDFNDKDDEYVKSYHCIYDFLRLQNKLEDYNKEWHERQFK